MKIGFNDTTDVEILHPVSGETLVHEDGELKGEKLTVTVYGSQSKAYKIARTKALNKSMGRKDKQATAEKIQLDAAQLLADCTKDFNNFIDVDFGYEGEYNAENAKDIYLAVGWLKDQVDEAIVDITLFSQPN